MPQGQVKPDGTPILDVSQPSLINSLSFYAIDTGLGSYATLAGPTAVATTQGGTNLTLPSVISTAYGKGFNWPGNATGDLNPYGYWAYSDPGTPINNSMDLTDAGTGVGFTFACAYYQTSSTNPHGALIFGRPAHANEQSPFVTCNFGIGANGGTAVSAAVINGGNSFSNIGTYDPGALNTFTSLACTVKNTSPGTATATYYANGSVIGTVPGLSVRPLNYQSVGQDDESQIMFGTVFHILTGICYNTFAGVVFYGLYAKTAWSSLMISNLAADPYSFLIYTSPNVGFPGNGFLRRSK